MKGHNSVPKKNTSSSLCEQRGRGVVKYSPSIQNIEIVDVTTSTRNAAAFSLCRALQYAVSYFISLCFMQAAVYIVYLESVM